MQENKDCIQPYIMDDSMKALKDIYGALLKILSLGDSVSATASDSNSILNSNFVNPCKDALPITVDVVDSSCSYWSKSVKYGTRCMYVYGVSCSGNKNGGITLFQISLNKPVLVHIGYMMAINYGVAIGLEVDADGSGMFFTIGGNRGSMGGIDVVTKPASPTQFQAGIRGARGAQSSWYGIAKSIRFRQYSIGILDPNYVPTFEGVITLLF